MASDSLYTQLVSPSWKSRLTGQLCSPHDEITSVMVDEGGDTTVRVVLDVLGNLGAVVFKLEVNALVC